MFRLFAVNDLKTASTIDAKCKFSSKMLMRIISSSIDLVAAFKKDVLTP